MIEQHLRRLPANAILQFSMGRDTGNYYVTYGLEHYVRGAPGKRIRWIGFTWADCYTGALIKAIEALEREQYTMSS